PPGYHAEVVATGLTFPTGVTFDDANVPYVVEGGYAYGEKYAPGRLLRIEPGGVKTVIAEGANQPWTGVAYYNGSFFVSQGGYPGKIARVSPNGGNAIIIDVIPTKAIITPIVRESGPMVGSISARAASRTPVSLAKIISFSVG